MAPKRKLQYSHEALLEALSDIKENKLSYGQASLRYNIPKTTLIDKIKMKYNPDKCKPRPSPVLTTKEELRVVDYIKGMSAIGQEITKDDLRNVVKKLLDDSDAQRNYFPADNLPSKGWAERFIYRYKNEISIRISEHLGIERAYVTEEAVRSWFEGLKKFLYEEHQIMCEEFMNDENACRIFKCDESGFPLSVSGKSKAKILACKGNKSVFTVGANSREQITVLAVVSADGSFKKPMIIHKGLRDRFTYRNVNLSEYALGRSETGWMTTECFFELVTNVFYPEVKEKVKFPILLLFDGHKTHINLTLAEFCRANGIIAYSFLLHASHLMQPLDVSVFGPLKKYYYASLKMAENCDNRPMKKSNFLEVFNNAWRKAKTNDIVRPGFKKCGLVSFNPNALDYSKLLSAAKTLSKTRKPGLHEKLGYKRALRVIERFVSPGQLAKFNKTLANSEKFAISDDMIDLNANTVYNIYKGIRSLIEGSVMEIDRPSVENEHAQEDSDSDSFENLKEQEHLNSGDEGTLLDDRPVEENFRIEIDYGHFEADEQIFLSVAELQAAVDGNLSIPQEPQIQNLQESEYRDMNICQLNSCATQEEPQQQQSCSGETSLENVGVIDFEKYSQSPFKSCLKIPDRYKVKRKTPAKKNSVPFAVSADKTVAYYLKKQRDKDEVEKKKAEKRTARGLVSRKLNLKTKSLPVKNKTLQVAQHIISDDDKEAAISSSTSDEDSTNKCSICLNVYGKSSDWIGCDTCSRWFHKNCLNVDFSSMTKQDIVSYEFQCHKCENKQKNHNEFRKI